MVPLISVYGRSGAGKSTVVRFVCENLDISYFFVNLRRAKTVFGAANLILAELGQSNLKSAQGLNFAVEKISSTIESIFEKEKKKLFVLVLDEYDILFYDKRGKPSDFIYKLLVLEENLRAKGHLVCIITISNNVLSEYELDDRVRSRIGSCEVFFEPYTKNDVLDILKERAGKAFSGKIDDKVLLHCATLSSQGHGDARRAIDLLRVAAELASLQNNEISETHIDMASEELQKNRIVTVLSNASYHFRRVCIALARLTFLLEQDWHATSALYKQYCLIVSKEIKSLTYRRVAELLAELENAGLAVSQTSSKGRGGYGTAYKLTVPPEAIGAMNPKMLQGWQEAKTKRYDFLHDPKYRYPESVRGKWDKFEGEKSWRRYVGID